MPQNGGELLQREARLCTAVTAPFIIFEERFHSIYQCEPKEVSSAIGVQHRVNQLGDHQVYFLPALYTVKTVHKTH